MLVLEMPTSDTSSVLPVIGLCTGSTGVHLERALIAFWCRRLGVLVERLECAWWGLDSWRGQDEETIDFDFGTRRHVKKWTSTVLQCEWQGVVDLLLLLCSTGFTTGTRSTGLRLDRCLSIDWVSSSYRSSCVTRSLGSRSGTTKVSLGSCSNTIFLVIGLVGLGKTLLVTADFVFLTQDQSRARSTSLWLRLFIVALYDGKGRSS